MGESKDKIGDGEWRIFARPASQGAQPVIASFPVSWKSLLEQLQPTASACRRSAEDGGSRVVAPSVTVLQAPVEECGHVVTPARTAAPLQLGVVARLGLVTPPKTPASPQLGRAAALRFWRAIPLIARAAVALVIGTAAWFIYSGGGWPASRTPGDFLRQTWQSLQVRPYRPSLQHADYNLSFKAQLNEGSVGWVFRASDSQHYHSVKLELVKGLTSPAVAITRFSVIDGEKKFQIPRLGPIVPRPWEPQRISFKAAGSRFSLHIGDQLVDQWVDDTLRSGGLGFLSENGELRGMHFVQVLFPAGRDR